MSFNSCTFVYRLRWASNYSLWTTVSSSEKAIFIHFSISWWPLMFSGPWITTGFTTIHLNLRISQYFCFHLAKLLWNSKTIYMRTFGQVCVIIRMITCEIVPSLCSTIGKCNNGHFRERNYLTMEKSLVRDNLLGSTRLITKKLLPKLKDSFLHSFFINMQSKKLFFLLSILRCLVVLVCNTICCTEEQMKLNINLY